MKITAFKSVAFSVLLGSLLGLTSCEKILRNMATNEPTGETTAAADSATVTTPAAVAAAPAPKEPEWVLTFPKDSKYRDLAAPKGVEPNPFTEIERIAEQHAGAANWADKHADIKGVLLQNERKDYYPILQQQAANEMLRHELFPHYYQDQNNPQMLNAIGFYTEHLLEAKSEDAELVYKGLRALQDHWPSERIAQAAQETAARVAARPITSAADTTGRNGSYRQIYARELRKMAQRLKGN